MPSNENFMIAGYAAAIICYVGYLAILWRRSVALRAEREAAERRGDAA